MPRWDQAADGSVGSTEVGEVTLPRGELERLWTPEYLERLARTYWRFLTRVSLGLLRVLHTPATREVAILGRPFVLLRFQAPEYEIEPDRGTVTWRIDRGLLVAPAGRGRGFLRISVSRLASGGRASGGGGPGWDGRAGPGLDTVMVSSEVANFYPMLAGWGWFARIGWIVYRETQLRVHVIVTRAFLRSLARLDLAPSVVGALRPPPRPASGELPSRSARR